MALLRVGWHNLWCKGHTSLQGGPGLWTDVPWVDPHTVDFCNGDAFVLIVGVVLSAF